MTVEQIKQKVDELDRAIDQAEQVHYQGAAATQAKVQAESNWKRFLPATWLYQLKKPVVLEPDWCKVQSGRKLQAVLAAKETNW